MLYNHTDCNNNNNSSKEFACSRFVCLCLRVGRILRPDQEHEEVIPAPEGRSAGSRVGSSSLPADGSAAERRGFLRGRRKTPQTSGQTL